MQGSLVSRVDWRLDEQGDALRIEVFGAFSFEVSDQLLHCWHCHSDVSTFAIDLSLCTDLTSSALGVLQMLKDAAGCREVAILVDDPRLIAILTLAGLHERFVVKSCSGEPHPLPAPTPRGARARGPAPDTPAPGAPGDVSARLSEEGRSLQIALHGRFDFDVYPHFVGIWKPHPGVSEYIVDLTRCTSMSSGAYGMLLILGQDVGHDRVTLVVDDPRIVDQLLVADLQHCFRIVTSGGVLVADHHQAARAALEASFQQLNITRASLSIGASLRGTRTGPGAPAQDRRIGHRRPSAPLRRRRHFDPGLALTGAAAHAVRAPARAPRR